MSVFVLYNSLFFYLNQPNLNFCFKNNSRPGRSLVMKVVYSFLAVAFFGIIHQGVATKCFKGLVSNTYQGTFPVHCYDGWETCYTMRITSRHNFGHVTNTYYGCLRDLDTCKHYCQQTLQTAPHLRVVSCAENCCYGDYCNMPFHLRS